MADVGWLTMFLDVAPDAWEAAVPFWAAATGTVVSPVRGPDGRFATLQPAGADAHLRVQRLVDGRGGTHLDLHVDSLDAGTDRVVSLGAVEVARDDDVVVLRSPGGYPFCVVGDVLAARSGPVAWGGHTSLVDQLCLDVPGAAYDAEVAFWSTLLDAEVRGSTRRPEFDNLVRPGHLPLRLLFQRVGHEGPVTGHPDLATDDRVAEVARLVGLGAERVAVEEFWTVLRAPGGQLFCVTERDPATGRLN